MDICMHCGKEIKPTITKIDENTYKSDLFEASIRGGLGNKELGKCCEECYELLKIEIQKIFATIGGREMI